MPLGFKRKKHATRTFQACGILIYVCKKSPFAHSAKFIRNFIVTETWARLMSWHIRVHSLLRNSEISLKCLRSKISEYRGALCFWAASSEQLTSRKKLLVSFLNVMHPAVQAGMTCDATYAARSVQSHLFTFHDWRNYDAHKGMLEGAAACAVQLSAPALTEGSLLSCVRRGWIFFAGTLAPKDHLSWR